MNNVNINNTYIFETENNKYIFDNNTSHIVPVSDNDIRVLNNYALKEQLLSESINSDEILKSIKYISDLIECGFFLEKTNHEESVKCYDQIITSPVSQLVLIVTEKCNMRCSYCIFGEEYKGVKSYNDRDMSEETAYKAVDLFFSLHKEKERHGCRAIPIISFYGGEPLLNFELIKNTVIYCEDQGYKATFSMTTNGTLLSDKTIEFLVEKNFSITISLDGNKEETNRKRVFYDGTGVFDTVVANSCKLQQKLKDSNEKKLLIFNACHDYRTSLPEVIDFFNTKFHDKNYFVTINQISPNYTDYYKQFTNEDIDDFYYGKDKLVEKFVREQINGDINSFEKYGIFSQYRTMKNRSVNIGDSLSLPCSIGSKMTIDSQGLIYICERVNQQLPIGNVTLGLDFSRIEQLIEQYVAIREENCRSCSLSRLCDICYTQMIDDNTMKFNHIFCNAKKKIIQNQLAQMYSILEKNEKAFE